jgi:hypothetical protein
MQIPVLEQAKIQAQVLVPLVKALEREVGRERAHALVRSALGDVYRRLGEEWWRAKASPDLGESMASAFQSFAKGEAIAYRVHTQSPNTYEIDVTGCRYAQFYQELGEPELGFLLICGLDFPFAEGLGADIKLTRTQTIMQGASHCNFATPDAKTKLLPRLSPRKLEREDVPHRDGAKRAKPSPFFVSRMPRPDRRDDCAPGMPARR